MPGRYVGLITDRYCKTEFLCEDDIYNLECSKLLAVRSSASTFIPHNDIRNKYTIICYLATDSSIAKILYSPSNSI